MSSNVVEAAADGWACSDWAGGGTPESVPGVRLQWRERRFGLKGAVRLVTASSAARCPSLFMHHSCVLFPVLRSHGLASATCQPRHGGQPRPPTPLRLSLHPSHTFRPPTPADETLRATHARCRFRRRQGMGRQDEACAAGAVADLMRWGIGGVGGGGGWRRRRRGGAAGRGGAALLRSRTPRQRGVMTACE